MLGKCIKLMKSAIKKLYKKNATSESPIHCVSGMFSIELPGNHKLPAYKQQFKLYDKFIPHLVKYLDSGDIVIDVGANCGDTLAAMVSENSNLHYICIEPDDDFFRYLELNTTFIKKTFPYTKIHLEKSLISNIDISSGLSGFGGTKHRDDSLFNNNIIKSRPLSDVLADLNPSTNLRLIKSDVDGYDYEVIHSAGKYLENAQLMLFFECQYFNDAQRDGFVRLLKELRMSGFRDFWFFDNFGRFLLNSKDTDVHNQLIDYIWRQNQGNNSRTIYYFDILVSKPVDYDFVSKVVNKYVEEELGNLP